MNTRGTPLAGLSEQELRAYLEPFGQEEDEYQRQLKVADALRNYQAPQSYGLAAGIGNGIATALNGLNGAIREHRATAGLNGLHQRETASAMPLAQAYINLLRGQQATAPQMGLQADPYAPPPSSYGL